jgi:hypothetical protein
VSEDDKRALCERAITEGACTLDGRPARVYGVKLAYARVETYETPFLGCGFAWPTVARIMDNGGAFKSTV